MDLFGALGFRWNREEVFKGFPVHSRALVCFHFHKTMAQFVWDASVLEGNPCTFPQVQTLMNGITVGGIRLSDQDQVLNLAKSCRELHDRVKAGTFTLNRTTFLELHSLLAREEALEWGVFRGEGKETSYTPYVALGEQGVYHPLPTKAGAQELITCFETGLEALDGECPDPFERAAAFFLFGALQQFFFDGNKRTSRLMMNGILMGAGLHALSIPGTQMQAFNEKMVRFYQTKDATEMFAFLASCHPDYLG